MYIPRTIKAHLEICRRLNYRRPAKDPGQIDAITTWRWFVLLLFLFFILFLSRGPFTAVAGGSKIYYTYDDYTTAVVVVYARNRARLSTRHWGSQRIALQSSPLTLQHTLSPPASAVASRLLFLSAQRPPATYAHPPTTIPPLNPNAKPPQQRAQIAF